MVESIYFYRRVRIGIEISCMLTGLSLMLIGKYLGINQVFIYAGMVIFGSSAGFLLNDLRKMKK